MRTPESALLPCFALLCPSYAQHKAQREQVEYSSHWVLPCGDCVGHVNFMLSVSFLFALGSLPDVFSGGI